MSSSTRTLAMHLSDERRVASSTFRNHPSRFTITTKAFLFHILSGKLRRKTQTWRKLKYYVAGSKHVLQRFNMMLPHSKSKKLFRMVSPSSRLLNTIPKHPHGRVSNCSEYPMSGTQVNCIHSLKKNLLLVLYANLSTKA